MEEQPPALLLFTKLGPVDWTTTEFLFPLFSLEASKLLTLLENLWKGSSSLMMVILRLVHRFCWYSKIVILQQMCSKRSFQFDISEFAWSWQFLADQIFSSSFFKDRFCLIFGSLPEADSRQQLPSFKLEQSEAAQHTNGKTSNCKFSKYWGMSTRLLIKCSVSGQ